MLSRELFRTDPERVRTMLEARHTEAPLDRLLEVDGEWRVLVVHLEDLKARRNAGSKEIGGLFRDGRHEEAEAKKAEMASIGEEIKGLEERTRALEEELQELELKIPNLFAEDVPIGADESANQVERTWGEPRQFDFQPAAHWDLGPSLGVLDFERATKIAGARFVVLRGAGAALERALINFMLDLHTARHGYTEVMTPYIVNSAALFGTGQLPKFADDLFHLEGTDYHLIPTAEVPLTNLHREEILDECQLPLRYCAFTPCFRSEAGSYGKDVRGLIRQHQFHKVELVHFATPETSAAELEVLTSNATAVLEALELPYQVVTLSSGDLGFSAAKTFDIEVWLPGQERYREISSCSVCGEFQARRALVRYRPETGKARFVHTLNGSALAIGRTMVAVLENYQEKDGSIRIPKVLQSYMGGLETIEPA